MNGLKKEPGKVRPKPKGAKRRKNCVCRKRKEWLSPGFKDGKPCNYCANCIPF